MRPKERRETGQNDLFRARLDQIVDLAHPVVKLARAIDWGFLEDEFGAVYTDEPGRPPLPTPQQPSRPPKRWNLNEKLWPCLMKL